MTFLAKVGGEGTRPAWWKGALLTLAAVLLAEGFAFLLPTDAQPFHRAGFLLVLAAVIAAAWRGGLVGGLSAGAVGVAGIAHLFLLFGGPLGPPAVRLAVGGTIGGFGLALAALIGHLRDRERRAVEALVHEREAIAQQEGRRFGVGRLFRTMGEAVVVSDAQGRIVMWNPAAERIFGYAREEALGMDVAKVVPAPRPPDPAGAPAPDPAAPPAVLTLPAFHKDGREMVVEATLGRVEDGVGEAGEGPFMLAIVRDVTERVRLTRDLEASNRALAASNHALSDANETLEAFTYVASHDLKEPVRALESYSRALQEDHGALLEGDADAADLVRRVRDNAGRLRRLIEGLLDYSRAARIAPHELEPLRVEDALHSSDCRTRFEHMLAERNGRLAVDPGPAVHASMAGLCQVLGNLVLNALKHNKRAGPVVRVRSATSREDPALIEVVVEDNGPGFPEPVLQAFHRAKGGRPSTISGGFGLIITRQAVEKMGGTMWLHNLPEGGGAVHFTLTAATTPAQRPGQASGPQARP